jgi:TetR/AcrR family transcriptional regulator, fatty acid metabolism regulator protein
MPRKIQKTKQTKGIQKNGPLGKIKLAEAMRQLLENKDFYSLSTDEIAKTAGINEALIYRYFGDKRGLLHHVLEDYLEEAYERIIYDLKGVKGSIKRLEIIIKDTFRIYCSQRVFAKIILVEVRNFPGYFESDTFQLVKQYAKLLLDNINEGVDAGELRDDIPSEAIRNMIIGGIEHMMLPSLFFGREINPDEFSRCFFEVIISGIINKKFDAIHLKKAGAVTK